jgi:hypothetical protein
MNGILIKKIKLWFLINFLTKLWNLFYKIKIKTFLPGEKNNNDEYFHFRWKIYSEEGYIDPQDFPDQQLRDEYDNDSLHVFAVKNNNIIACVRFVLSLKGKLPTERAFNLINFHISSNIGEISKLCLEKKYRRTKIGKCIFLSLMCEIYKFMKKNKIKYVLIGVPQFLKKSFEKTSFVEYIEELSTGVLKPEHLEERKTAKKYFEKVDIKPYLIKVV